ncbi:MAG: hypothetical protein ACK5UT_17280 [Acidobacteriota bacterium]
MPTLDVIDSHTRGEPTRRVIAGGPDLGPGSMAQRLASFRQTLAHRPDLTRPADPHAND